MSASVSDPDTLETLRALLRDAVTRLIEHAEALTDDLSEPVATYRPTAEANSIAWLLWHAARAQDIQIADLAGAPQAWDRWVGRFGLDLDANDTGYGHTPEQVAKVRAPAELLVGYYRDVHERTLEYLGRVDAAELNRVVDTGWDPPVTAAVRLVSIIDDCAQHLGQAAYLRGIVPA